MIEMNDRSATTRSTAPPIAVAVDVADVEPLEHRHPLIVADLRVQLPMADVERHDVGGATLQQAIGESACRRAGIEHTHARDVDAERLERGIELVAASADEPRRRSLQHHRIGGVDEPGRLVGDGTVDQHACSRRSRALPSGATERPARGAPCQHPTAAASTRDYFFAGAFLAGDFFDRGLLDRRFLRCGLLAPGPSSPRAFFGRLLRRRPPWPRPTGRRRPTTVAGPS